MYSVPMALVDFLPVIFFGIAAVILQRDLYSKMSKGAFALFAAGTIDVFMAGFLKAVHKLLFAAGVCDFERLYAMFFPVQAIGFSLCGAGILAMMVARQEETRLYSFLPLPLVILADMLLGAGAQPPVYEGTLIFIVLMVLGVAVMDIILAIIAGKMKKPWAAVLFVLAFLFSMMMGYLGTREFDAAYMEWAAEAVNVIGQGALLLGTLILHKAGLAEAKIK